jgi:hypothetical protein
MVKVPEVVIGLPVTLIPVPAVAATLVTVPEPLATVTVTSSPDVVNHQNQCEQW